MPPGLATTVLSSTVAFAKKCAWIATPLRWGSEASDASCPAIVLCSISHSEWSRQMIPTPCAPSTSLSRIAPIDISPIVIPRSDVSPTRLCSTSTIDMCVTIPSRTPTIVQRSTMLISLSIENEMSMPCTHGPAGLETVQPSIITLARRTWMPSSSEPTTCTFSSITWCASSMSMPFSPPCTVTSRSVTWSARITMPPLTMPPTSVCACRITSGPCTVPCRCTVGGRTL